MKILFTLLVTTISFNADSQTDKPTYFGAKLGYNNSNISGKDSNGDAAGYLGNEFYVGFFIESQLKKKISLQTELIYSFTEDYNFLEVPLNIRYTIYETFWIFAGPKFDFLLDNDEDIDEANYEFRNFGVSLDLGVQYHLSAKLFVEVRYSVGLVEQLKRDIQLDINNATRNTFRIGIGYKF